MSKKTHWKERFNYEYLGAWEILESGKEWVLTINKIETKTIDNGKGSKEERPILHFKENCSPMVLNKTNAGMIAKIHKTPYVEDWIGKQIQVYSSNIKAFNEYMDALRVRDYIPKKQLSESELKDALDKLYQCDTVEKLKSTYQSLPKHIGSNTQVIKTKDEIKAMLS